MLGGRQSPQLKLVFQRSKCYQMTACNSAFSQHFNILLHRCCEGLQWAHTVCEESEMSVMGLAFLSNTSFGTCILFGVMRRCREQRGQ